MPEIVAGTRWEVDADARGIMLQSDDFENDVTLHVLGDFATPEDRIMYAQALADRLNGGAE